jgi:membrane protease YdiL (CAAX protease family)
LIPGDGDGAGPRERSAHPDGPEAARDGVETPVGPAVRPGASTFTIEGRQAPALFVIGWLATIIGLGGVGVALLSGGSGASPVLLVGSLVILSVGLIAGAGSQAIERRARGSAAYLGPSPILVFAASIPLTLLVVIAIGIPLTIASIAVEGPLGRLASVVAQALLYVALIRLLVVDAGALGWAEMGVRRFDARAVVELGRGAVWALPIIALTTVVAAILTTLLPVQPVSPLPPAGETVGFAINLLAGAVVAPIGEELFFRAFATTAWARDLGARRAIVRGAIFFALVHVLTVTGGNAPEALALALVGFATRIPVALMLGWLFLRSGSVWTSIGLHAAFNGVLLILAELALRSGVI